MQRKIKVALVITRMDRGGAADMVRFLLEGLSRERFEVTLIFGETRFPSAKTAEFLKNYSGDVRVINNLQRRINPARDIAALAELWALFRRKKFDIVHTHTAKAGFLGRCAARGAKVRGIVHTPHGHNLYGYFGAGMNLFILFLERFASSFTDAIIALTELERNDCLRFKICAKGQCKLIYQGLELEAFAAIPPDRREIPLIAFIGRLEKVKGAQYFLEAIPFIAKRHSNALFIFAGEGSMRNDLEKRARQLGIETRCSFTGWKEDVVDIFSKINLLVAPSLNEAVGMVLLEAQSAGVPVVATRVGGIPEVVKEGVSGVLVPAADPSALAEAVSALLADPGKRARMAEEGRRWVQGRFKKEAMVRETEELYRKLFCDEPLSLKDRKGFRLLRKKLLNSERFTV